MSGKSSIKQLPRELRDEIDRAIRDGSFTIDDIVTHLRSIAPEGVSLPSRSSIGRYKQRMDEAMASYREAQEVAGAWVAKLGEDPNGDVGKLLGELLKTVAFQTLATMSEDSSDKGADPKDLMFLARAIKDLGSFDRIKADLELKMRDETRKRLDAVEAEVEKNPEMDKVEILRKIRQEIYGVFE